MDVSLPIPIQQLQLRLNNPSIQKVADAEMKSCVALLMRPVCRSIVNSLKDVEVLFMLRAENEGDRWGGQVAFPGGKQEQGETDEETCAREVFEEIGVRLPKLHSNFGGEDEHFVLLGPINDRRVIFRERTMAVRCFVYYQVSSATPQLTLNTREVAACAWCGLEQLLSDKNTSAMRFNVSHMLYNEHKLIKLAAAKLNLDIVHFTKVNLDISTLYGPEALTAPDEESLRSRFYLWGLTLGFVNDFLVNASGLRAEAIILKKICFGYSIETVYANPIHNVLLAIYRSLVEKATGTSPAWNEYIVRYTQLVVLAVAGLASTLTGKIVSKL